MSDDCKKGEVGSTCAQIPFAYANDGLDGPMPPYSATYFSHNAPSDIGLQSIYLLNGSLHHDNLEGSTSADFVDFGAHHYIICSSASKACSYADFDDLVDYLNDDTPISHTNPPRFKFPRTFYALTFATTDLQPFSIY